MPMLNEIGAKLTTKIGPLPVWAYGGIGAVGIFLLTRGKGAAGGDTIMPLPDPGGARASALAPNGLIDTLLGNGGPSYYSSDLPVLTPFSTVNANGDVVTGNAEVVAADPSGNKTQTTAPAQGTSFFQGIGNLFKIGGYYTAIQGVAPKYDAPSGGMTIPGTNKTQGITPQDLVSISNAQIASDPSLQQKLADANVTAAERNYAVLGPGGILTFSSPEAFASAGLPQPVASPITVVDKSEPAPAFNGTPLTGTTAEYFASMGY